MMRTSFFSCFKPGINPKASGSAKIVFYDGTSRILKGSEHVAGEIMFEFPDHMVCNADSFFIGHPIPALPISAKLERHSLYLVLPIDKFANRILSTSSLSLLQSPASCTKHHPIKFGQQNPFEFVKGSNGRTLIKVVPEFIVGLITLASKEGGDGNRGGGGGADGGGFLCSTPELKKQYEQLVGKEMTWSPKLETISEYRIRFSPCRFIEWAEKEKYTV
uniref:Uncharacterized protein n=1 Tax=Kalanchoe fedtschenkoi TaxID=63787 RepID=A0A7N0THF5_KALFE